MADPAQGNWDLTNPTELDYLRPTGFKFQIHNMPNVSFFCQSANIPDMMLGQALVGTPLIDYFEPGEKIRFGELNIRFLIQENMDNYKELQSWMIGLGSPQDHKQYKEWGEKQQHRFPLVDPTKQKALGNFSDATLFVLDSNNNPAIKINFEDCFPIALGGLDFDISSGNTEYFQGLASFRYKFYTIENI